MSHRNVVLVILLTLSAPGCKKSEPSTEAPGAGVPAASTTSAARTPSAVPKLTPTFATLPASFVKVPLYGPGSETILAPPGTRAEGTPERVSVKGPGIELTIRQGGASLEDWKAKLVGHAVEFSGPDVVIYGNGQKHNFRAAVSLTPEWDDNDVRRFSCSGGGEGEPPAPVASQAEVELWVSVCRSLTLPPLE